MDPKPPDKEDSENISPILGAPSKISDIRSEQGAALNIVAIRLKHGWSGLLPDRTRKCLDCAMPSEYTWPSPQKPSHSSTSPSSFVTFTGSKDDLDVNQGSLVRGNLDSVYERRSLSSHS